jgi:isochorismate hydrolase
LERAYGLQVPQNLKETCDPQRLALIVYDMQVGILSQIDRHLSLPKELMGVSQLRMAMTWQRVSSVAEVRPYRTGRDGSRH